MRILLSYLVTNFFKMSPKTTFLINEKAVLDRKLDCMPSLYSLKLNLICSREICLSRSSRLSLIRMLSKSVKCSILIKVFAKLSDDIYLYFFSKNIDQSRQR